MEKNFIHCMICQRTLDLRGLKNLPVVTCKHCHEATPIKNPPFGMRYVRCSCDTLLICKNSSTLVACTRDVCGKLLHLEPETLTRQQNPVDVYAAPEITMDFLHYRTKIQCASCGKQFAIVRRNFEGVTRCTLCNRKTLVGQTFIRNRRFYYALMTFLPFLFSLALTVATTATYLTNGFLLIWMIGPMFLTITYALGRFLFFMLLKESKLVHLDVDSSDSASK